MHAVSISLHCVYVTADGEPPIMSDVEEDDDGAPQQMVCVTVDSTPYRSPTQVLTHSLIITTQHHHTYY